MLRCFVVLLAWPIVKLWFAAHPGLWRTFSAPDDEPCAEATGPDPDRVLLLGPGKSFGYGVSTHQLGLGGHLARELSALTKRGCVVDIVSEAAMSVADTRAVVEEEKLQRFDAVVLTLGAKDAFRARSLFFWRKQVGALLDSIHQRGGAAMHTFILGIAPINDVVALPAPLTTVVNAHIAHLNSITENLCSARVGALFLPATAPTLGARMNLDSRTYSHWARELAPTIAASLAHVVVPPTTTSHDAASTAGLDVSTLTAEPVSARLATIADSARVLLNTSGAAIAFHGHDTWWSTSTLPSGSLPLGDAGLLGSAVFLKRELTVVADTHQDERFAGHPWVAEGPRMRFYAGCPVRAIDNTIVGAIFVFDTEPRSFDSSHESLLNELALRAGSAVGCQ